MDKKKREQIENDLLSASEKILHSVHAHSAVKLTKLLKAVSKKIAKKFLKTVKQIEKKKKKTKSKIAAKKKSIVKPAQKKETKK